MFVQNAIKDLFRCLNYRGPSCTIVCPQGHKPKNLKRRADMEINQKKLFYRYKKVLGLLSLIFARKIKFSKKNSQKPWIFRYFGQGRGQIKKKICKNYFNLLFRSHRTTFSSTEHAPRHCPKNERAYCS